MIHQEYLKSKQWHYSNKARNQHKIIKTKLEELILSLPLNEDYFDTHAKISKIIKQNYLNNYDALIKYIKEKDEIGHGSKKDTSKNFKFRCGNANLVFKYYNKKLIIPITIKTEC